MQTSDNYEMNLPESTDLVNLVNDYNPNFETIDAEMFGNKIASIGTATELKSGTVHAITRNNSDAAVFRFVATADWELGDQLTVDGVSVTALLPNGETLDDGAYVINANVLCILTGTVCTFIGAQGQISEAQDSLRLGGELPAYYGTASDVTSATNIANAASTLVNTLNTNLAPMRDTLTAGSTTISFSSTRITGTAVIDVYVDIDHFGVIPTDISLSGTTVTITFEAQDDNMEVGIMIF